MTTAKIDLVDTQAGATSPAWNVLKTADTTAQPILDINGNDTGWTMRYDASKLPDAAGAGYDGIGVGDAAWADDSEAVRVGVFHNNASGDPYSSVIISGPASLQSIQMIGSYGDNLHSDVSVNVNGGTAQTIPTYDAVNSRGNNSEVAIFPSVSADGNSEFVITWAAASTSRGYLNAIYLEGEPQPAVTLNNPPQLGATLSGAYANFVGTPTGPIQFDQGTRSLPDEAITVTAGTESWVTDTALPGLPANGASVTPFPLIGENITITLPDPGA